MRKDEAKGRVLHASHDHVHVLRYVGQIRHPLAPSIDNFVNRLFDCDDVSGFVIDLSEADSIDSTNLGELARIARRLLDEGGRRPVIISPKPDISQVLHSMAFDEVFEIEDDARVGKPGDAAAADAHDEDIPIAPLGPDRARDIILEAHRCLMEMSDENRQRFKDVVAMLESEAH